MRTMNHPSLAVIAAATILSACSGNPAPGQPNYAYNVSGTYSMTMLAFEQTLPGTAEMAIADGGDVTGTFTFDGEGPMDIAGAVSGDTLTFSSTYERSGGCEGLFDGVGVVVAGGDSITGTMEINDSCAGVTDEATFELTR